MSESPGLPPEHEAVRRLLADARHDGPPPPDVVARLDDTLASLVAERDAAADTTPVVDLGARRRRTVGVGLLAAAAIVVAGVAVGQGLPRMQGSDDTGSAASGDSATSQRELDDTTGDDDAGGSDNLADSEARQPEESFLQPGLAGRPTLFSDDDEDIIGQLVELRPDVTDGPQRLKSLAALRDCDGVDPGRSSAVVAAQVDGESGLVVYRRPVGETQDVELYACGNPEPLRTNTLPAP